jgi:hypothetical protein
MAWVADLVDRANELLNDRNTSIGPSFFMHKDLNDARLARIWTHEITPLLEDYFFDAPERVREFDLKRLHNGAAASEAVAAEALSAEPVIPEEEPVVVEHADPQPS